MAASSVRDIIQVYADTTSIPLGRQCENKAKYVYFELSDFINKYGEGTATLVHMRPSDLLPYVCTTSQSGSRLMWELTNMDTAYAGKGQCELRWSVDDVLVKSVIYSTEIIRSIVADTVVPDPYESWYESLLSKIDEYVIAESEIAEIKELTSYVTILSRSNTTFPDADTALFALDTYGTSHGAGRYTGFIKAANAEALGLSNVPHFFDFYVNSANERMLVARPVNGNTVYQLAKQGGTWSDSWTQLVSQASIDAINASIATLSGSSLSYNIEKYTSITSGADLNTFTTYGQYRSNTSSITNSLSNCPVTGIGFVMNVFPTGTNLFLCQEIYTTSSTTARGKIVSYRRFVNARDSLFGEWRSVETDIDTNTSSIATNTSNIAANASAIAANASDISTLNTRLTTLAGKVVKTVLSNTQTYANATSGTYNYQSINGISDYDVVLVRVDCGNIRQWLTFVNGDTTPLYLWDYSGTNAIRCSVYVDWTNNRVYIRYLQATGGYTSQHVSFSQVVGFIKL